ncbi:mitochondrial intermembrane space import and assembly protein 40 [Aspergillus udagawae]|uniref:Mitochondrial intermembrane space import and assembly protein 40 n=1 Tax=Aspergillus udagawae TaxID=91492 RepID=A0A8H3XRC2_9EURO|nr:mitochondrial intermembrane space import and assembly protein 40 [Aspergillus udagawae]GFF58944.1 mitochondrial intermembrane space import and assembly protein 40 [Aspergillus udagawae]GFF80466.1 mitochondrial intermembrane space import and assembly protein 40 [Aspergillus udagawae]GFG09017.1 mitochondrial intermembrane space import and assembly protein 40 [Aspergillus udagawae]GFG24773.1 mitochondrial intermembrane space import and assembly protein 40 [Aspergillus udagawae]
MFRPATRVLLRAQGVAARGPASRRLISTAPPNTKSRSWKNTAVRLGLAVGAVYYYNTSNVFAEQPSFSLRSKQSTPDSSDETHPPTLDSIKPRIREERQAESKAVSQPDAQPTQQEALPASEAALMSPQELEDEASQEAAFNPETGEINWDCPCLGGMAHGPCGEEFKAAFSCFVYSTEEPKGMDCIDKFKGMQECFRRYPDVYGAELEDDEEADAAAATAAGVSEPSEQPASPAVSTPAAEIDASSHPEEKRARAKDVHAQVKSEVAEKAEQAESEDLIPKAWHDTEGKNGDVTKAQQTEK